WVEDSSAMSFKVVILPPVREENWAARVREVVPGAEVVICADAGAAAEAIVDADAAFGTVPRELLARAGRLRWIQAPAAGPPAGVAQLHPPAALDDLLPRADFVIITAPETPQTQRLFDRARLRRMKPSAYLINISRGAIVVLDDLVGALQAGELAGAALD